LLDAENKLSRAELTALAQDIKTSAKRLYRTFRNFMLYMQLEREELLEMPTSVINKKWLEDTCKSTLTEKALKLDRVADSHFHSTLTNDFSLSLVKNDLFYSIEELLWNALRFSKKNTPIGLEITEQKESITISISNHTLPSDFFEQAEPFRQLNRDTQEQQGSGLGIYLCKELAKRNAWELSHAYQNDQSTISLRIRT
jgi:K+-sensing histidine kinase KdpD